MPASPSAPPENVTDANVAAKLAAPAATRLLYGGYLMLALAAAAVSWKVAPSSLAAMLAVLVTATVTVSLLTAALSRPSIRVARIFLWSVLLMLIISLGLFLSAVLLGFPEAARISAARVLGSETLASGRGDQSGISIGRGEDLPAFLFQPLDTSGDRFERAAALSKRESVTLTRGVFRVRSPQLSVSMLRLDDATLLFEGPELTIEAIRIEAAGASSIRSVTPEVPATGQPGVPSGALRVVVYDRILGRLSVDLRGGPGGSGADGSKGVPGADGPPGENSAQSLFDCRRGGGTGGAGMAGGRGGDGSPGAVGGDGGSLILIAPKNANVLSAIAFWAEGGIGGRGGVAGSGGPGGKGGPGGRGGGYCGGGQAGALGPPGAPGLSGAAGRQGAEGRLRFIDMANEQLR